MRRFNRVQWSPVEIDYLKKHKTYPVNQLTISLSKSQSAIKNKLKELDGSKDNLAGPTMNKRSRIGKRKDCNNLFFRSGWEANVYRLLVKDENIKLVEYEPTTFTFTSFGIIKGTVSYTPDFKITYQDGSYSWIEVKGQIKATDKTKIRRFIKFFPEEAAKLCCVVGSSKTQSAKFFESVSIKALYYYNKINSKYRKEIPHWE